MGIRPQSPTPNLLFSLSICCSLTTKFENILIEAPIKAHLLLPATRSRVSLTVVSRNAGCELQHRLMREQVSVANRRKIFYHPSENILHTLAVVVSKRNFAIIYTRLSKHRCFSWRKWVAFYPFTKRRFKINFIRVCLLIKFRTETIGFRSHAITSAGAGLSSDTVAGESRVSSSFSPTFSHPQIF